MAASQSDPGSPPRPASGPKVTRRGRRAFAGTGNARLLGVIWSLAVLCGGLVILLAFLATIGAVDFSENPVLGIVVVAMAVFWLTTMWTAARARRGETRRSPDRERRGF